MAPVVRKYTFPKKDALKERVKMQKQHSNTIIAAGSFSRLFSSQAVSREAMCNTVRVRKLANYDRYVRSYVNNKPNFARSCTVGREAFAVQ